MIICALRTGAVLHKISILKHLINYESDNMKLVSSHPGVFTQRLPVD